MLLAAFTRDKLLVEVHFEDNFIGYGDPFCNLPAGVR